jgi:hypothetical protein
VAAGAAAAAAAVVVRQIVLGPKQNHPGALNAT